MDGMNTRAVEDLLTARGAWRCHKAWGDTIGFGNGLADGGEEYHLANG